MKICGAILVVIIILGIAKFWNRRVLIILLGVCSACFAAAAINEISEQNRSVTSIEKNENGQGNYEKELIAKTRGGEEIELSITVPEKGYTKAEAEAILRDETESLDSRILGDNESLDEIRSDISLPSEGMNAGVAIQWQSSNTMIINALGEIQDDIPQDGQTVTISATLSLQDEEAKYSREITVYPKEEENGIKESILEELERQNSDEEGDEYVLPQSVDGEELIWYEAPENTFVIVALLFLVVGILIRMNERQKDEEKRKKRNEKLRKEYPEFVSRLLLMLYAGTGARTALFKIAAVYAKTRSEKGRRVEAFEELLATCREMDNGRTEEEAYESMAQRCALPCYRKLSVLLVQNLKRGGKGFTDALEQEVLTSFGERRRLAEIEGNAASLKLIIPLGMMLVVALALMVIPAIMSM